jgi:hypothetical protein
MHFVNIVSELSDIPIQDIPWGDGITMIYAAEQSAGAKTDGF